ADYTIARHYPALKSADNPYLELFVAVSAAQAALIARWMLVGFIHGVMNTDNMSIAGETIDYGPCAFMDNYDPETVFSSIDTQGRYAYAHQPLIAQWNLTRFAETLIDLIHPDADEAVRLLTEQINEFPKLYTRHWLDGMRARMGLATAEDGDLALAQGLLSAMEGQDADYTQVFRGLSAAVRGDAVQVRAHFANPAPFDLWLAQWQARLAHESSTAEARAEAMDQVNPIYIPRNHKVEEALAAATQDQDLTLFKALLAVLEQPFAERPGLESYTQPAPEDFGPFKTFCGT
ncbi:protein adenylyltransferase SelO family protein, partial [Acidithiobacillus sp.]|uniref:protein adenylyltransferase SelO family protein n=1 Tax=Acidithiobacillus sp. TaxID=1872118 RepID=UPI002630D8CB